LRRALRAGVPLATLERGVRMVDEDVDDGFKRCRHPSEFAVPALWALVVKGAVQDLDDLASEREPGYKLLDLAGLAQAIPPCPEAPRVPRTTALLFKHFASKFPTGHNRPLSETELLSDWYALEGQDDKWTLVHGADGKFATGSVRDLRERCKLRMREEALHATKKYTPAPRVVARQATHYLFARRVKPKGGKPKGGKPKGVEQIFDLLSSQNDARVVVNLHESAQLRSAGAKRLESDVPLAHWTRFIPHKEYGGRWGRAHTYDTWERAEEALRGWAQLPGDLALLAVRGAVASCQAGSDKDAAFHAIKIRTLASTAPGSGDAVVDVYCPMFVVRGGAEGKAPRLDWRVTQKDLEEAGVALIVV